MFLSLKNKIHQKVARYHYKYLTRNVEKPNFSQQQIKKEGYYSQYGQDKWVIEQLLPDMRKGVFVDIGANDGITLSNTYLLEKRGWTGLAIEPIPTIYERLVKNRKCIIINGCISEKSGKSLFRLVLGELNMLSGLVDEYDPRHLERIKRDMVSVGGDFKDIEVNCYNFNELLNNQGISHIDYLNIDVEGGEYKILNSIDFDRVKISVIGVENNYKNPMIPKLLMNKGFIFHSIVGDDDFYLNRLIA